MGLILRPICGGFIKLSGENGPCGFLEAHRAILRRVAAEERPKIFEGAKDISLSLAVVVIMMLLAVGATGLCSINSETQQGAVQEAVSSTHLRAHET